ncbi:MAG: hypothetical protein ACOX5R_22565 [bacterium]|jgi:hypothetical protein
MTEIIVRFKTDRTAIDPAFFEELRSLAEPYGLQMTAEQCGKEVPVQRRKLSHQEFVRKAEEISRRIGPVQSDSAQDIRALRESR